MRDVQDIPEEADAPPPKDENPRVRSRESYDSQEGRSVEELNEMIRDVVKNNYQKIEQVRGSHFNANLSDLSLNYG